MVVHTRVVRVNWLHSIRPAEASLAESTVPTIVQLREHIPMIVR